MRSSTASLAVRNSTGRWGIRVRIRRSTSRPSKSGQHDVEDRDVRRRLGRLGDRRGAGVGHGHVPPLEPQRHARAARRSSARRRRRERARASRPGGSGRARMPAQTSSWARSCLAATGGSLGARCVPAVNGRPARPLSRAARRSTRVSVRLAGAPEDAERQRGQRGRSAEDEWLSRVWLSPTVSRRCPTC